MKIRSLLLGSIAAAGLVATGAHAADLGVATSLDVCDALGLSGLTISSDSNCLQITGGVSYELDVGDFYNQDALNVTGDDTTSVDNDGFVGTIGSTDWKSKLIGWLRAAGTADSDFGQAKAVVKIYTEQYQKVHDGVIGYDGDDTSYQDVNGDVNMGWKVDEAYVSVGDATVLMAGKKGTIINYGDDEPFNWLGTFNSSNVDGNGVRAKADVEDGGTVIQVAADLGNGVDIKVGLEDIADSGHQSGWYSNGTYNAITNPNGFRQYPGRNGTAVGVLEYKGDNLSAHITGVATGVLDGVIDDYMVHAGFTGVFGASKLRAAIAADDEGYWNALATASTTIDMFTLAASFEAVHYGSQVYPFSPVGNVDLAKAHTTDYGAGASITAQVTDTVTLNLGGRWYHEAASSAGIPANSLGWGGGENDSWQVAGNIKDQLTESLAVIGEVGAYDSDRIRANPLEGSTIIYGSAGLSWAPGGGFSSSVTGTAQSNGAYKAVFTAAKNFQ
jgi:hypothetical protein